jgi:hypothetical protein
MMARPGKVLTRSLMAGVVGLLALSLLSVAFDPAFPQSAPAQPGLGLQEQEPPPAAPQQAAPAPQESPAATENPGLVNQMGKLLDKVIPGLKSPSETIDDLNTRAFDAAKDVRATLSHFAVPGTMIAGRMICPLAVNGTPDCKLGADKLCQSKGFKEGKSLNTDSAQTCSAKVLIPGRTRKPDDCRTDNYVTSALCQ